MGRFSNEQTARPEADSGTTTSAILPAAPPTQAAGRSATSRTSFRSHRTPRHAGGVRRLWIIFDVPYRTFYDPIRMTDRFRAWAVGVLLCGGLALCLLLYPGSRTWNPRLWDRGQYIIENDRSAELILVAVVLNLALIPVTRNLLAAKLDRLRAPSLRTRRWTAAGVLVLSGPLLYGLGAVRGRLMLPMWHDENMYRMQTTFLAHGKLCMPGLPLPDFFESPYIFVRGVYTPVYFPGTALMHVPAVWLHLPYWLTPLLIAAVSLMLLYLIVAELVDGLWALIAVALMISLATFRWQALIEMSHIAGMMWGLTAMWAWLAWRRRAGIG